MKIKISPLSRGKTLLLTGMLALGASGFSQNPSVRVFEDWNTTSGTQNDFQRCVTRSKSIGGAVYYYLCGSTVNSSGNYELLVQKKDANGVVLWSQTYDGTGNGHDYATDVQISSGGSVYVSGTYYMNSIDSSNAIIIKYNNSGTQQWVYTYNGSGSRHDAFAAMQLSANTLVAVGSTWKDTTNKYDFLIARIDTNGNSVWTQNWNYNNLNDGSVNLWNKGTTIYVAGGAQAGTTTYKYAVVSVKFSDGTILGSQVTGGNAFGIDQVTDVQTDGSNYLYVTGGVLNANTLYDWKTIKLDTALNIIWSASYDGGDSLIDIATGLTVDQVGNVIVTGYRTSTTSGKDYVTIKYSSGGTQRWVSTFDDGINANDSAAAIVVSSTDTNKIYVTGFSYNGSSKDYWTVKYDGAGNQKWDIGFNNKVDKDDRATAIALDTLGSIVVAGQNKLNDTTHTYTTVKYIEKDVTNPLDSVPLGSAFHFRENRGQVFATNDSAYDAIQFYNYHDGSSEQLYFADLKMSYVWVRMDTSQSNPVDTLTRIDMQHVNAKDGRKIYSMDERADYSSYFQERLAPDYIVKMKHYEKLFYPQVYTNIDMVYGSNPEGLRYFYMIKPGGAPSTIMERYTGADSVYVSSGKLIVASQLDSLILAQPTAWQIDTNGNVVSLTWQPTYSITDSTVSFSLGSYNTNYTLIIALSKGSAPSPQSPDPNDNLEWATHYAGSSNWDTDFETMKVDNSGNVYVGGTTSSTNFPTLIGFQTGPGGGGDGIFLKFDTTANPVWVSYLGGSPSEFDFALDLDTAGNVIFAGTSSGAGSSTQFLAGAYNDNTFNGSAGDHDWYIGKIKQDGSQLMWATYFGGSSYDDSKDVKVLEDNRVYIVGQSRSSNFPIVNKNGAFNSNNGYIAIAEFNSSLDTTWSCRFGGTNLLNIANAVDGIASGKIIVVGTKRDNSSFPIVNPGGGAYVDSTVSADGFIMTFNQNDTITWSTGIGV